MKKRSNLSPVERIQVRFFPYAAVLLAVLIVTQNKQQPAAALLKKKNQYLEAQDTVAKSTKQPVRKPQSTVIEVHTDSTLVNKADLERGKSVDANCELVWLAVDSLPFVSDGDVFAQVSASDYFRTPAVLVEACPYNDKYVVSVIQKDSFFYPKRWLTDSFWSTSHWVDALKYNDTPDGDTFLSEALGLEALLLDSLTESKQLWKFKMDILSTLSITDSMKNATSAEMKNVLVLFTATMQEKSTN